MTDAGWAERRVLQMRQALNHLADDEFTLAMLKAEHARSVRIVKRQLGVYQRQREVEKNQNKRDLLAGSILACVGILVALQQGRGGNG